MTTRLFLFAREVRDAIWTLDHVRLPQRTLANWLASGLVRASARWTGDQVPLHGVEARGSGKNSCKFTVPDFVRVRLVAQLRYSLRLSMAETEHVLQTLGPRLDRILRGKTDEWLVLDPVTRQVRLESRSGAGAALDVRASQYVLDLGPLAQGNDEAVARVRGVA